MPLHKRFAKQLDKHDYKSDIVHVEGVDNIYDLTLVNEVTSRTGRPQAVAFSELIEQGLATGDLKEVVHRGDKLIATLRSGINEEKEYEFRVGIVNMADHIKGTAQSVSCVGKALDKIAADIKQRIQTAQSYQVYGDMGMMR